MGWEEYTKSYSKPVEQKEGDYFKDGLLYCGVCNQPKEFIAPFVGKVTVPCECQKKINAQYEQEKNEREKEQKIEKRKRFCFINDKGRECTFMADENPESEASRVARAYCEKWNEVKKKNLGLMFFGDVGAGKSFLACCIANELIERYRTSVMFRTVNQLINDLEDWDMKQEVLDDVQTCGLLILDDVGSQRDTSYGADRLYTIVNARYEANKPLIVTTNLTATKLVTEDIELQRSYDRILEMCPKIIPVKGGKRRSLSADRRKEINEILGV